MGKKNKEKVKEKKAAHKAHLAQLSLSQSRVAAANALDDPLKPFSIFHNYNKNSLQVSSVSSGTIVRASGVKLVVSGTVVLINFKTIEK